MGILAALVFLTLLAASFWWMSHAPSLPARRRPTGAGGQAGSPAVLIPVTDLPSTQRAVELACRLNGAPDLVLLHVAQVALTLPLDALLTEEDREGRELLALGRVIARAAGRQVRCRMVRDRDLVPAVLRVAGEEGVTAIVLGVPATRWPALWGWRWAGARIQRQARCEVIVDTLPAVEAPRRHAGGALAQGLPG